MTRDPDCVFCKIVAGKIPASVVLESDTALAFLDVGPLAEGHLLVIPREHYADLSAMPPEEAASMASLIPSLGRAARKVTGAEGFNVLVNEGRVAGQEVPHVHAHIIPRAVDDGLGYRWKPKQYAEGKAAELTGRYREALTGE